MLLAMPFIDMLECRSSSMGLALIIRAIFGSPEWILVSLCFHYRRCRLRSGGALSRLARFSVCGAACGLPMLRCGTVVLKRRGIQ